MVDHLGSPSRPNEVPVSSLSLRILAKPRAKLGGPGGPSPASPGNGKDRTDNVNFMASNLHGPRCATSPGHHVAVPHGDLSQKITVDCQGEVLELKQTIKLSWVLPAALRSAPTMFTGSWRARQNKKFGKT